MVNGFYNGLTYVIEIDGEVVYQAGNSPYESQGYVSEPEGVGVETMKEYCTHVAEDFAQWRCRDVGSISFKESIDFD